MRESFGGAFTIKVVLVFIVVYVSFMAVAVNYAKTFRVKNKVIDILEQSQYNVTNYGDVKDTIDSYLGNVPYLVRNESIKNSCLNDSSGVDKTLNKFTNNGVCIILDKKKFLEISLILYMIEKSYMV